MHFSSIGYFSSSVVTQLIFEKEKKTLNRIKKIQQQKIRGLFIYQFIIFFSQMVLSIDTTRQPF